MREFVRLTRCIIATIALAIIIGLNCGEGSGKSSSQTEERSRWTTVSDVITTEQRVAVEGCPSLTLFSLILFLLQLDWLQQLNYSHEQHNVTTNDGYQLQLQRLPQIGARPVLLVHGLLSSSLGWVCLGPDKSLGKQQGEREKVDEHTRLTLEQLSSCIDATTTCGWRICVECHPTAGITSS